MKKIFIIDDNLNRVLENFGNIYKMLWKGKDEEGIAAEVIFFGDKYKRKNKDSDLQQENIDFLKKSIKAMLRSHCRDEEVWDNNGEMFQSKKRLIENLAKYISINESAEIDSLIKKWKNMDKSNMHTILKDMELSILINKMFEDVDLEGVTKKDSYILLDIILLYDDDEKVGEDIPIISMGLYDALKKQGYNCYLYSSFAFDYLLIDNYKKIYEENYGETIEVYHSKKFFSRESSSDKCLFYQLNR